MATLHRKESFAATGRVDVLQVTARLIGEVTLKYGERKFTLRLIVQMSKKRLDMRMAKKYGEEAELMNGKKRNTDCSLQVDLT
jgi:predicted fused transcriptional regulator/phosphomethylpyrimidine kinase